MNHLLASDADRRAFQAQKHVSLDLKASKRLAEILGANSSSDEEFQNFQDRRKQFQSRKHKSLDARVKFNLDKDKHPSTSSSDEEFDTEGNRLIQERIHDFSKPIIIDIKDLDVSEDDDEDFLSARESFQKQRSISTDSRKR